MLNLGRDEKLMVDMNYIVTESKRIEEESDLDRAIEVISYFRDDCGIWMTPDIKTSLDLILKEVKKKK